MDETARLLLCLVGTSVSTAVIQRLAMHFSPLSGGDGQRLSSFLSPSPFPWGDALAALAGLQAGCLFLLLTARPASSVLLTFAVLALLVLVNHAKLRVLREPLVLADAWLLTQIFRYPHLYFPFLPVKKMIATVAAIAMCLTALLAWETPLSAARSGLGALALAAVALLPALVLFWLWQGKFPALGAGLLARCPVYNNANTDASRCGPLTAALLHPVAAGQLRRRAPDFLASCETRPSQSRWPENFTRFLSETASNSPSSEEASAGKQRHVVLVQAESLCDIRQFLPEPQSSALADFLPNWDSLRSKGQSLPTPQGAFGAYTMRTEFSILTGLQADALGPFFFNPYLLAARQPLWSLARHFLQLGYRTLCVHPYAKDFFRRDKVMPNLGFERLVDIHELAHLPKFGPYTSDAALAEWVLEELARSEKPVFCFVITMEAHGPWREGRLTEPEMANTLHGIETNLFSREMQMYLCHLRHMDAMVGLLENELSAPLTRGKNHGPKHTGNATAVPHKSGILWVYGDHAPGCMQ